MPIYNVHLEIPEWVQDGIRNGDLARNAAGIIRRVDGGQIVAHLREVGVSTANQVVAAPLSLAPLMVGGLQLVTLCYAKARFDRLEDLIKTQNAICHKVLEEVKRISAHQYFEQMKEVRRGLEYLVRWRLGQELAVAAKAEDHFIEGTADLWAFLLHKSAEELLEQRVMIEILLQGAVQAAAGELECKAIRDRTLQERNSLLALHQERWETLGEKIEALPPPRCRFPTKELLQTSPNGNYWQTRNKWLAEIESVIEVLEGQRVFEDALNQTEPQALTAWARGIEERQQGVLCLVPSSSVSEVSRMN